MIKLEGTILICDGTPDAMGNVIDISGVFFKNPIPVLLNSGALIGTCEVTQVNSMFIGTFLFSAPSKLPSNFLQLKPRAFGSIQQQNSNIIEQCSITRIDTVPFNADPRIKAFEQFTSKPLSQSVSQVDQDTCQHEPVQMIFTSFCRKCNKTL